jgi:hypothetical protein
MSEAPSNPVSLLRLGASTKHQIQSLVKGVIEGVDNGDISALETFLLLKAWEDVGEEIKKAVRSKAVSEASQYQGKLTLYGNEIETFEAGTKYDYSKCGDTIWERLNADANTAIEKRKSREALLRSLKEPETVIDAFTGEIVTINPPPKTSTTTVKITIK